MDSKLTAEKQQQIEPSPYEQLLSEVSSKLAAMNFDQVNAYLPEILQKICLFTGTQMATFLQIDQDTGEIQHSHQWISPENNIHVDFTKIDFQTTAPWVANELLKLKPIPISTHSDFPDDAIYERTVSKEQGIKSVLWTPVPINNEFSTCIALNSLDREIDWSQELIDRLVLLCEIIGSSLQRGLSEKTNRTHIEFDKLLTEIAASLVSKPTLDLDIELLGHLGSICEFFNIRFGHILLYDHKEENYLVTYEWKHHSIDKKVTFRNVKADDSFPWLADQFRTRQVLNISSMQDFPEDAAKEQRACEAFGIKSVLFTPFEIGEFPKGILVLNAMEHEVTWDETIISRLSLAGEIFANALKRKESETMLAEAFSEIESLKEKLEAENIILRDSVIRTFAKQRFVGRNQSIEAVLEQVGLVAPTSATVLLLGETGTGKELLAREIHARSHRHNEILVSVNCAALPAELVESELFGHEKGAYTGATTKELGRFEVADGGTIFLDEIGDLPLSLQVKLLRVLQEGEFERLGSSKTRRVDTRIIAATNRNLEKLVRSGDFREDLFYRLNVFPITIPPLRDRMDDVPDLVDALLQEIGVNLGKKVSHITDESMQKLRHYSWPGNVRELRNVLERAAILSKNGELHIDLPNDKSAIESHPVSLEDAERKHILEVLNRSDWKISGGNGAAQILGLKPSTLRSKMNRLGITRPI